MTCEKYLLYCMIINLKTKYNDFLYKNLNLQVLLMLLEFILMLLSTGIFWFFMLSLMVLGRWLLVKETLLFSTKKEASLTATEMKKKKL